MEGLKGIGEVFLWLLVAGSVLGMTVVPLTLFWEQHFSKKNRSRS